MPIEWPNPLDSNQGDGLGSLKRRCYNEAN